MNTAETKILCCSFTRLPEREIKLRNKRLCHGSSLIVKERSIYDEVDRKIDDTRSMAVESGRVKIDPYTADPET